MINTVPEYVGKTADDLSLATPQHSTPVRNVHGKVSHLSVMYLQSFVAPGLTGESELVSLAQKIDKLPVEECDASTFSELEKRVLITALNMLIDNNPQFPLYQDMFGPVIRELVPTPTLFALVGEDVAPAAKAPDLTLPDNSQAYVQVPVYNPCE